MLLFHSEIEPGGHVTFMSYWLIFVTFMSHPVWSFDGAEVRKYMSMGVSGYKRVGEAEYWILDDTTRN